MSACPGRTAVSGRANRPAPALGARRRAARGSRDGPRHVRVVPVPAQRRRPGPRDRADDGPAPPAGGEHPGPDRGRGPRRERTGRGNGGGRSSWTVRRPPSGSPSHGASRRGPASRCSAELARQAAWRVATTGLGGALLAGAETGVRALDARLGADGRLAAIPLSIPVGLALSYVVERRRVLPAAAEGTEAPSALRSVAVAAGLVGGLAGGAYGEHLLADVVGRPCCPAPPAVGRVVGHGAFLAALGVGVSSFWHRAMRRLEAGTTADAPVIEADEATHWVPSTVSGGPGSLVPWATLGREGRRHALAGVRPQPLPERPDGVPDLSVETVMGEPARAAPVQVYVGLDSAGERPRAGRPRAGRDGADRCLRPVAAGPRLADRHGLRELRGRRRGAVPGAGRRRHRDAAVLPTALAALAGDDQGRARAEPAALAARARARPRAPRAPAAGGAVRREPRRAHQPGRVPPLGHPRPGRARHRPRPVDRDAVRQQVDAAGHRRGPAGRRPGRGRRGQRSRTARAAGSAGRAALRAPEPRQRRRHEVRARPAVVTARAGWGPTDLAWSRSTARARAGSRPGCAGGRSRRSSRASWT